MTTSESLVLYVFLSKSPFLDRVMGGDDKPVNSPTETAPTESTHNMLFGTSG